MALLDDAFARADLLSKREPIGYLEGLIQNAFQSAVPGQIGIAPSQDLQLWQQENPIGDIVSGLGGYILPFAAWGKVATPVLRALPETGIIGRVASKGLLEPGAQELLDAPFKANLAREIVRFAPFEAGRVAAAATIGEQAAEEMGREFAGVGSVATQAATELGLLGLGSGAIGKFTSIGARSGRPELLATGQDISQPPQLRLRKALERAEAGEAQVDDTGLSLLRQSIRNEGIPEERGFLKGLLNVEDKEAVRELSRLAKPTPEFQLDQAKNIVKSKVQKSVLGLINSDEKMADILNRTGFVENWEQFVQYPRYIMAKTKDGERRVWDVMRKSLKSLDSEKGIYWGQEDETGLYLLAKKLGPREWIMFKTDSPGVFAPTRAKFLDAMEGQTKRGFSPLDLSKKEGAPDLYNSAMDFYSIPTIDARGTDLRKGLVAKGVEAVLQKSGASEFLEKGSAAAAGAHSWARSYLYPGMFQMAGRPIQGKVRNFANFMRDKAEGLADEAFFGKRSIERKTGGLVRSAIEGAERESAENLHSLFRAMNKDPESWKKVLAAASEKLLPEKAIEDLGLSGKGLDLYKRLLALDAETMKSINFVQEQTGHSITKPLPFHMLLSHFWKGEWTVPIRDEAARVVGYISHKNKPGAEALAKRFVETAKKELGATWTPGSVTPRGEDIGLELAQLSSLSADKHKLFGRLLSKMELQGRAPQTLAHARTGARGYVGDPLLGGLSPEQAAEQVLHQLRRYNKYQAEMLVEHTTSADMGLVAAYVPKDYEMLVRRIGATFGRQGSFSQEVNSFFDKALSPVLGRNSADKIIRGMNSYKTRISLGFVNISYNMANLLTFAQTALPQLAYLTTAHPEQLSKYYTYFPVLGKNSVTALGQINIWKVMQDSFKNMWHPDDLLWKQAERAAREAVTDPRFLEEYVGQKAQRLAKFQDVLKGEEKMSRMLAATADLMPGTSERLARGHSFVLGHTFFKNVVGVKDEELLYQLSKQFTENSNFLYTAGDRARIITGTFGTGAGLFKNWIMHYLGWMGEYSKEALVRGNWKPLLFATGGTAAVGGVASTPVWWAADTMSRWMSDKTAMEQLYSLWDTESKWAEDSVYFGLPGMLGFSLQNQVAMPGTDPGQDAARLFSAVHYDFFKYGSAAIGQAFDHARATGQNPIGDLRTREMLYRAFAPKMVYRASQAAQDGVIRSSTTGYPTVSADLGISGKLLHAAGVDVKDIAKQQDVVNLLWKDQTKRREATSTYGEEWASAVFRQDTALANNIIERAYRDGIDISSVIKSGNTRLSKMQEVQVERQFDPEQVLRFRGALP